MRLRNFIRAVVLLGPMGGALMGYRGMLTGILVSAGFALATDIRSKKPGSANVNICCNNYRESENPRNHLALELNQVRLNKMCCRFDLALSQIDDVLVKDPEFSEALILKAQLLWEGFNDRQGAKHCLLKVVKIEPDENAVFHRWAMRLYRQLSEK